MFLNNKYTRIYFQLIKSRCNRNVEEIGIYYEWHHIIPKSMGGRHTNENFIALTFREHFLAHWLLIKMTEGESKRKMLCALAFMRNHTKAPERVVTGWQYDLLRKARINALKGRPSKRKGQPSPLKGIPRPQEAIDKMIETKKNNPFQITEEHRERVREIGKQLIGEKNPFFGHKHSEETRKKFSKIASNRPKYQCDKCKGMFVKQMLVRWHGPNCRVSL